jgi:DNA polymerase-3 subunit alpha
VTVGGIVSDVKHLTTKRGDPMVFLTLDDPTGTAEVVVFNSAYQAARELCVTDRILIVRGRIDHKQQGETKVVAAEVTAFEAVAERREVRFSLDARETPAGVIRELARLVREFPGDSPVYLALDTSEGPKTYALGPEFRVRPDPDFIAEARSVLGGTVALL